MTATRKRMGRRWWLLVAVVVAVGAILLRPRAPSGRAAELPPGVQVATVTRGTLQHKISASGAIAAQTGAMVKIGSQITGRIRRLPADVGTHVTSGQVVAILDATDLAAQVEQQRHNVAAAEASLAQAESRFRQAQESSRFTRQQTSAQIAEANAALQAAGARVDAAAATARLQPTQTGSEITRAQAALSTAQSQLKQVEQTVRQQHLQAEASGEEAREEADNAQQKLARQERLLRQGFIAAQDVDNSRTSQRQAAARLASASANVAIVAEKTEAELQAARDQVAQAQANLEVARASRLQVTLRTAELQTARQALRQAEATLALRRASHFEDRIRQMAVTEARGALSQARESLLQARSQLQAQLAQLDKAVIRSPISGTVLSIAAQQGETVAAGLAAPTLITVADLTRLEVRAYVDETDIGEVRLGLPAEIRVSAFPTRVFHGRITKIASASTTKDNVVTYETTVALADGRGLLRPDMTADVSLLLGERREVVMVPSEAVHRELERSVVYVLHRDRADTGRVEARPVKPGLDDGADTEVRSGLQVGEELVVAGLARLGVRAPDAQTGGAPGSGGRR